MQIVKKSLTGYRETEEEYATHVILSFNEYENLKHIETKYIATENQYSNLYDISTNQQKNIKDLEGQINLKNIKIDDLYGELQDAKSEIERQKYLNSNLKRISKERSNSERGIKPKKHHHGYIILTYNEHIHKRVIHNNWLKTNCWKVRIQSPYNAYIPYDVIEKDIDDDLKNKLMKELKIDKVCLLRDYGSREWGETVSDYLNQKLNFIFKKEYKANGISGFWEVEYLVKYPVRIPENMILHK